MGDREVDPAEVNFGDGREAGVDAGKVHALVRRQRSADLDDRHQGVVALAGDTQPDRAVGEVDDRVDVEHVGHLVPGHRDVGGGAVAVTGHQHHLGAVDQLDDAAGEMADAQLRSGQVAEDADLTAGLIRGGADVVHDLGVTRYVGMREVQAEYVHPGLDHLYEGLGVPAGRSDRCDDFRFSDCSALFHGPILTRRAPRPVTGR